jgi:hypothetical protein
MRPGRWLGLTALLAAISIGGACGGGKAASKDGAAGIGGGAGGIGGSVGGAAGGADGGLVGCLETPGTVDRPASGRLPCELIPPGLRL